MGEFELLSRVRDRLGGGERLLLGSGDDASVTLPAGVTATSVDAVVDGVHFRRADYRRLDGVGRKALAAALSDLAAMGVESGEAYVAIGVPADLDDDECLEIVDGMVALSAETGTVLAGGDIVSSPVLFLSVTVVGHAASAEAFVSRAGARPEDSLVVTGELGGAAAGLALLADPKLEDRVADPARLRVRQLEPQPRLAAGHALAEAGATAMIDLSDGLAGDAVHLGEQSGVGLRIDGEAVPLATGAIEVLDAAGGDGLQRCLEGGEDYELLATIPAARFDRAREAVNAAEGIALTAIGEVLGGDEVEVRLPGGRRLKPVRGFDQLARLARQ